MVLNIFEHTCKKFYDFFIPSICLPIVVHPTCLLEREEIAKLSPPSVLILFF